MLAIGGRLEVEWLLDAYAHGIFPWPIFREGEPLVWWSPDPRAIFELDGLHISRRLERTLRSPRFSVTSDRDFRAVIAGCASVQDRPDSTWLTDEMIRAYVRLHEAGYAHSVEVWRERALVGGVYGVALGGLFAAESMFYTVSDASKVALVHLVRHLRGRGYQLFDIQQLTEHTRRLGAIEIPRRVYLRRLARAVGQDTQFGSLSRQ